MRRSACSRQHRELGENLFSFAHRARARARTSTAFATVDEALRDFVNHEKSGVPRNAGTDTTDGFDLGRMHRLLRDFDDPHRAYNTIHVSGTKGKGTTVSVLASVLRAAGLRIGTYKSPHVYTVAERIRSSESDASAQVLDVLRDLEREIKSAQQREGGQLSYFEVLTALAFAYFKKANVDLALVEVGLGGSRDATNVLAAENLEAAVITHIGEEHLEALGGSIETIVDAKAGIAHKGRPVFCAPNVDERITTMLKTALRARGANVIDNVCVDTRLVRYHVEDSIASQDVDIDIKVDGKIASTLSNVRIPLAGPHQRENISLALRVLWWLRAQNKIDASLEDIRRGLETTRSPGNFEVFETSGGPTMIADGAHTKGSARVLVNTIREVYPDRKLLFVVAMADDKDHGGFIEELYRADPVGVVCTQMQVAGASSRTTPAKTLAKAYIGPAHGPAPTSEDDFEKALKGALSRGDDEIVVVVTGSLYTFKALSKALL